MEVDNWKEEPDQITIDNSVDMVLSLYYVNLKLQ